MVDRARCGCRMLETATEERLAVLDPCSLHKAAPALLEALEFTLQRCIDNGFEHGDLAEKARAAIAQAKGGSVLYGPRHKKGV